MAAVHLSGFLRRLTCDMAAESLRDRSDAELVNQALSQPAEMVFRAIVQRHGAMVYRVCWRVLRHEQDAEDAFQATFVVLARKLRAVRKHASLASWLHGVAHRVALKLHGQALTRRRHEHKTPAADAAPPDDLKWREVQEVLDAELGRLQEKWRLPLILCYLQGRTQDEAAATLGCAKSTLRLRLDEARAALGRRLTSRGITWPAAFSGVLVCDCLVSGGVPPALAAATASAAAAVAAGKALTGVVASNVVSMADGAMRTALPAKFKSAVAALVMVCVLGGGFAAMKHVMRPDTADAAQPRLREIAVALAASDSVDKPKAADAAKEKKKLQVPEIEKHLAVKYPSRDPVSGLAAPLQYLPGRPGLKEIDSAELAKRLPETRFFLTTIHTPHFEFREVSTVVAASFVDDRIDTQELLSPLFTEPKGDFLRRFRGIKTTDRDERERLANVIAELFRQTTHKGSLSPSGWNGSRFSITLWTVSGGEKTPWREIAFAFDAAGMLESIDLENGPPAAKAPPGILRDGNTIMLRQSATDEDLQRFKDEKGIVSLRTFGMKSGAAGPFVSDAGLAHIKNWSELRELSLSMLSISDGGLAHIAGLTKLEKIVLCDTKIGDAGLVHLARLTELKELWLDFLPITDAGAAHLRPLSKLKVLRFHNAPLTDAGFANFKDMKDLEDLQLGHARITDMSMPAIAAMKKLKVLDLRTKVTDAGLAHLEGLSELSWLCLNGTETGDAGLASIRKLNKLEWLLLDNTRITDAGLRVLGDLPKLKTLSLSGTKIGDAGLEHVAGHKELELLRIDATGVTDAGLARLKGLRNLKRLELQGTKVTQEGIDNLKTALTELEVIAR